MTSKPLDAAADELKEACDFAKAVLADVADTADSYSNKSSEVLFGLASGLGGLLAGAFLASAVSVPAFIIVGATTGLGVALGIVGYRGKNQVLLERRLRANRTLETELKRRIESLPENAPYSVRDRLWEEYALVATGSLISIGASEAPKRLEASTTPHEDNE